MFKRINVKKNDNNLINYFKVLKIEDCININKIIFHQTTEKNIYKNNIFLSFCKYYNKRLKLLINNSDLCLM